MTEDEALGMLRSACAKAGSISAFAKAQRFSVSYVSDVLLGRRPLGPRILDVLELRAKTTATTVYFRKTKGD